VCVRLCDVAPDGGSTRVTYGVLNLTHRDGSEKVTKLVPGRQYKVRVPLIDTAYSFAVGHRMRVAISTTYWPLIWPSPEPVTLSVITGKSALVLPVRPRPRNDEAPRFEAPEAAAPFTRTILIPGGRNRTIHSDHGTGETVVAITDSSGRNRYDEIDLIAEARSTERYSVIEDSPLSASADVTWTWEFERKGWCIRTESRTHVSCNRQHFIVRASLEAFEGEKKVFARNFDERVRRNGN
jgi:hypothetical protein